MQRSILVMCVFTLLLPFRAEGKLCQSIDVRNSLAQLNQIRNCTVIVGYLRFAFFVHTKDQSEFSEYSFPELKEITEYLILYNVKQLRSLSGLFPNLRVIRGRKLFVNFALIIYRMEHMEEIGLQNLLYIEKGDVIVDHCPKLCYVDTIDWGKIGAKLEFHEKNTNCTPCARECGGYCWNAFTCQKLDTDKCHEQCLGCKKYNSSRDCNSCKNYEDNGECVQKCPKHKYNHHTISKCVTESECSTMLNGTWWLFQNQCINSCPAQYALDTQNGGCKFCGNECVRYCSGIEVDNLQDLLALEGCTHINGSLEIHLDKAALALNLEVYLGKIVQISDSLTIRRSSAITNLNFLRSLKAVLGKEFLVYENINLQQLWDYSNFSLKFGKDTQIGFHDNPLLCISEIDQFVNITGIRGIDRKLFEYSNGYKSACNIKDIDISVTELNSTSFNLSWPDLQKTDETIIGYTLYYIDSKDENISTTNVCEGRGWNSTFISNNSYKITDLRPYTTYGYYLKTMSQKRQQTPVYHTTTLPDDPTEPTDFAVKNISAHSVTLEWGPPNYPNGNLSHYIITYVNEPYYMPHIESRDYCRHPHIPEQEAELENEYEKWSNNTKNCSCQLEFETKIFNKDIFTLCTSANANSNSQCKSVFYEVEKPMKRRELTKELARESARQSVNLKYRDIIVPANTTTTEIRELLHYSLYVFYISACNYNITEKRLCGPIVMITAKTKKNITEDFIGDLRVQVENTNVSVYWQEPKSPNAVTVAYQIEYQRADLEHAKPTFECVTHKKYSKDKTYKISQLLPGKYNLRVRSASLPGPGEYSDYVVFEIETPGRSLFWIIFIFLGVALFLCVGLFFVYQWYKRKHILDNLHLITSINPDYAGPIYEEDEWEIDRSDIDIWRELGKGSFGMVYEGYIKSRQLPCAIKTINSTATKMDKMEFLNEGSVMKGFCDAHHVIKLLGVVSRGQIPYVVMELMERGDLKSYLRRCREPSQNLTSNEMYLMAAEIADGMSYLAAKKFVHRDLAARNCMVAADRTIKIGDFGMARDIYETDYYRKETVGLLPVRWMAPESLADGVFTSDSDCWSYGIVLWEIATLAEQPYQGLSNEEVFRFVKNRGKLDRPSECSDMFYEIMDACWAWRPNDRPTFRDIVDKLSEHVGEGFRLVAFCFSDKGREFALNSGPRPFNPPAMQNISESDTYGIGKYDASEEDVSLFIGESSRPKNRYFPFTDQRIREQSPKYPMINPGSPDSYSLNSDNS